MLRPSFRRCIPVGLLLHLLGPASAHGQSSLPDTFALVVGRSVERTIAPGQTHLYALPLESDRWVYAEATQRSVDVAVTAYAPDGVRIKVYDNPARGIEPVQFTSGARGVYLLRVRSAGEEAGAYQLVVRRVERSATTSRERMRQLMASYDQAGVAGGVVTVVQRGRTLFSRGFGLANLESGVRNTPSTPYHLASLSKQFTAFAIALLASQGRVALSDDVRRFIPELPTYATPITLDHLLHHTSGLRDDLALWEMGGGRSDDAVGQSELLALVLRQRELNFPPGTEYDYTNSGYLLLAEVVQRVSGVPFRTWMATNVWSPLGMTNTQVNDSFERVIVGRARSYEYSVDGMKENVLSSASTGATGVVSTAADLARWLRNWGSAAVGGPSVLAAMQTRGVLGNGDTIRYALGTNVRTFRGLQRIDHGGYQAGYRTMLVYYPSIDAGVIVLGNTPSFREATLADAVAEIFFGRDFQPERLDIAPQPVPVVPSPPRAAVAAWRPGVQALSAYTGAYYSPELETIYTLAVAQGKLVARHRRHAEIVLAALRQDTMTSPSWMFGQVMFERDSVGAVSGFRVTASNERVRRLLFSRLPAALAPPQ